MKQTRGIKTGSAIGGSDGGVATGTIVVGNTAKAATA